MNHFILSLEINKHEEKDNSDVSLVVKWSEEVTINLSILILREDILSLSTLSINFCN
jgi:hypothetical protein